MRTMFRRVVKWLFRFYGPERRHWRESGYD
jgi:hypothetical protein